MGKAFLLRWLAALVLVMVTYNPTPLNYVRWAQANAEAQLPFVILVGLVLVVAYIIFLRATFRSIGLVGIVLVLALFGVFFWVLWDWGMISLEDPGVLTWLSLIALSLILGVGLSWSIIRRRLSGQLDVDDVDEA